ncbi:amidohydrolase family protein [Thermotoga sp. SG1]|uniref:amidohydrolase family protein n=1 Tax=Thermotoga sp. SG1 TaxID=126739 RepID=UPI000C75989E|nr:amidohydrolase [Thermotoga sp. SG1]PLV57403.1 amidohydrolase [Thermotoga sp. SG1]
MIIKGALVWNGRKFVQKDLFVENGEFVEKSAGPVLDARGYFLVPGFVDSHAHVVGTGFARFSVSFSTWDEFFKKNLKGDLIVGRGWFEEPDEAVFQRLDRIEKPVFLIRRCGHKALLNKKAMEVLNVKERYLLENLEAIYEHVFKKNISKFYRSGEEEFLKHGVTFVQSDDLYGVSVEELLGVLKNSRVRLFEKLKPKGLKPEFFGDLNSKVHVKGVKVFMDGSLGARTALISGKYDDGTHGVQLLTKEKLEELARFCDRHGLVLNIHAIGDEAVSLALDVLERYPGHRIVHAQFVKEEDLKRAKNTSFSVQPHFYFEDQPLLKNVKVNALLYPFRKMFEMGISISFSSDSPVSPCDPKYIAEHALKMGFSRKETFYLLTEAGAKQVGIKTGRIEKGFRADFCLYERDPLLFEDDPVAVFVEGWKVYG